MEAILLERAIVMNQGNLEGNFKIDLCKRNELMTLCESHFHNCYELYYLSYGEVKYFINDSTFSVKKGDFILIPPHIIHKTTSFNKPTHKRMLIHFYSEFIEDFLKLDSSLLDCFRYCLITLPAQRQARVEVILRQLLSEFGGIRPPEMVLVKSLLGELLVMLNRHTRQSDFPVQIEKQDELSQCVLEVVDFINKNYHKTITLNLLSNKFFVNPTYLSRVFKKVTGFSYVEYLTRIRLKHAIKRLEETNHRITQIAMDTGFNSSNHFCKVFKSFMGTSPLQYRNLL